jgi:hypothetical protein
LKAKKNLEFRKFEWREVKTESRNSLALCTIRDVNCIRRSERSMS